MSVRAMCGVVIGRRRAHHHQRRAELVMNHHPRVLWMKTHHRPRILSFVVFPPAARALRRTPEDPA